MHAYATDATDRKTVPTVLALIAVLLTIVLTKLMQWLGQQPPWYVDTPSVMAFFGFLWLIYDKYGWRFSLVGLSKIPDLRGTWRATIISSYEEGSEKRKMEGIAHIRQTWTKISIRLEFDNSASTSTMASINTEDSSDYGLNYEYLSEPDPHGVDTMQIHRGTAHLRLTPDGKNLKGSYYTGRGRMNFGSLTLAFVSRKLMTYEEVMGDASLAESAA